MDGGRLGGEYEHGVSALTLERKYGISHEHAWTLLQRYREAMLRRVSGVRLHGGVEVDETYIGGKRRGSGKRGRTPGQHQCVLVAVERRQRGRARMQRTENARAVSLLPVVQEVVKPGASCSPTPTAVATSSPRSATATGP